MATRREDVSAVLRGYLATGHWKPGDRLLPEPELAASLGVSRATLREALRALHEEGLITRTRGAGTFVARTQPRLANNLDINSGVSDLIRSMGMAPGTRTLSISDGEPSAEEAAALELAAGDPVVIVERVRTADGNPVVFSRDTYPRSVLPGKSEDLQRLSGVSIYDFLENYCGITVNYGIAKIGARPSDKEIAALLEVPAGTQLLTIDQTDFDDTGRPVLRSHEFHLADAFDFTILRRGGRSSSTADGTTPSPRFHSAVG